MKKRMLSLLCVLALCLGLLPVTALAEGEDAPDTLYVGEIQITASGYWTTDPNGKLAAGNENNYNVYYDGNGTLTLNNATIQGGGDSSNTGPQDYGIYAATTGDQSVSLTIKLIGSNKVSGYSGICVGASDGNSTLVIQSDTNGSLETSGSGWNGITVSSNSGNASLTINSASVTADTKKQSSHGVSIKSSSNTELSLTVNGGSLTARGTYGIFYSSLSGTNPSTSLTVSGSALIKAVPSIHASVASVPTPKADSESGGIVFDGTEGTVYGDVTLQDDLTIDQDETLTIPEGSTLTTDGNLNNDGTIVNKGTMNGDPTGGSGTVVSTPTITTESLPDGTVDQSYNAELEATGNNITWSASGLPNGLAQDPTNGTITGTPTTAGQSTVTVTATNSAGTIDKTYTLNIQPATVSVTSVSLNKTALSLTVDGTEALIATVKPDTATDKTVTWESSDSDVATVDQSGNVKAVSPGTANITVKTVDGSHTATCAVTVTQPVTGVTLDQAELSLYTGESKPLTATVQPDSATNKNVTWSSDNEAVATVDDSGKVTAVTAGEANITVKTEDGNHTADCKVTVTDPVYKMTTDPTALDFGSVYTGYTQPAAKTVTLTNTGNQTVTVTLPTSTNYIITAGTGFTNGSASINPNGTATFTVQPKAGLVVGTYSESITVSGTNDVNAAISATFTVRQYSSGGGTPSKTPSQQATDKIESAKEGSTVEITLRTGQTKLDKEVFEELAGRDVTLEISLSNGVTWTVNGQDIPENADLTDLDMGVSLNTSTIPVNLINSVTGEAGTVQLTLKHDGPFGFKATLVAPLGEDVAGMYANLYRYDDDAEALDFEASGMVDEDGTARLAFDHASLWLIALDTRSHALPFADTGEDLWYSEAVRWAWRHGVMTGYADGSESFGTNDSLTRAQMAAVLYNVAGKPDADMSGLPGDCDGGAWYATCVSWALGVGVFNGYGDGSSFGPDDPLTREQAACVLMNAASVLGADVSARTDLSAFPDADEVSPWASDALSWAVAEGVLSGVETADGARELQPTRACTRAAMAALMMNLSARSAE